MRGWKDLEEEGPSTYPAQQGRRGLLQGHQSPCSFPWPPMQQLSRLKHT